MHPVPTVAATPSDIVRPLAPGDQVRVTLRDGRSTTFVIETLNVTALVARGGATYPRDEIVSIERRQFSGARTAVLVAGLVGGALLIVAAAIAAAYSSLLTGG